MAEDDMVRLRAPVGTDEANFGETRYHVHDDGTITVPRDVALAFENSPSGFVPADDPAPAPVTLDMIRVRGKPGSSASWRGQSYSVDDRGLVSIPAAAYPELASHGFRPAAD